jgi:2,5-furandicarboxylate decarboxylase 1
MLQTTGVRPETDLEKFRLRTFVDHLRRIGELEVHDEPVALADLSVVIESTPKATLFTAAGPERFELVAAVSGSRSRLAAAFGVDVRELPHEHMRRLTKPQMTYEISSADAPVHAVVRTGADIDLTTLPFHLQHEQDGAPYISSAIDFSVDPVTGRSNVGCRRLMFRDRTTILPDLIAPSDLKKMYLAAVARNERLPVSFVLGSHPLNYVAATLKRTAGLNGTSGPIDEFSLVATVRGESLAMVRGVSNGILVPADAEMVIEGYLDELGHREAEGPYAEFYGFYGPCHDNPIFHVTAITSRKDVLHQTVRHGIRRLGWTESANLGGLNAEAGAWKTLRAANIEPAGLLAVPASNGRQHVRVALRRGTPGEARLAIAALFSVPRIKHVFVVDEDVDVFDDQEMEWALATRFRADHDIVVSSGFPKHQSDPVADADQNISKAGFDLTAAYGRPDYVEYRRPNPPAMQLKPKGASVRDALRAGPRYFKQLMDDVGSNDGREVGLELAALREAGAVKRLRNGEWTLSDGAGS